MADEWWPRRLLREHLGIETLQTVVDDSTGALSRRSPGTQKA
jgi:hypothetical protein